jgi:hypothetical protein
MRSETLRLQHEQDSMKEKIRENGDKIKQNKVLPYLVSNVVEVSHSRGIIMVSNTNSSHTKDSRHGSGSGGWCHQRQRLFASGQVRRNQDFNKTGTKKTTHACLNLIASV